MTSRDHIHIYAVDFPHEWSCKKRERQRERDPDNPIAVSGNPNRWGGVFQLGMVDGGGHLGATGERASRCL